MNTAARIRRSGQPILPTSILSVVMDADNVHCLTEADLDTWWASQSAEQKAEIHEASLGPAVDTCKYCGCDDLHARPDGCGWFDKDHTVCDSAACVQRYLATQAALQPVTEIGQQFTRSITACGSSLAFFRSDPELTQALLTAVEQLLPRGEHVDAHF